MNKKLMWMPALAVSITLGYLPVVNAHDSMYPCSHMSKIEKSLDLTAEQKAKLKEIKTQTKADMKDKFKQIHDIRHQINELIKSGSKDNSQMDDLVKQETDVLASVIKERISVRQQIYGMLTDAQKTKFADMVNKWEEKHIHETND